MNKIFLLAIILLGSQAMMAQKKDCNVNLNGLDETYTGDCKKGLAHGEGVAEGTLGKYTGEFKKGFPHGQGKIVYATLTVGDESFYEGEWIRGMRDGKGTYQYSKDSVATGYWEEDRYIGLYENDYVAKARGQIRHRFSRVADSPYAIEIQFVRDGARQMKDIVSLSAQHSTGNEIQQTGFFGYEQVEFPFEGRLIMTLNNQMRTNTYSAEFDFTINKPGKWIIVLDY